MKEEWNSEDYQGRTRKQVENQYLAFSIFVSFLSIIGVGLTLYAIFNNIF